MNKYLYKVQIKSKLFWNKFKPLYIVSENKGLAKKQAQDITRDENYISNISCLGRQETNTIFNGNYKEKK